MITRGGIVGEMDVVIDLLKSMNLLTSVDYDMLFFQMTVLRSDIYSIIHSSSRCYKYWSSVDNNTIIYKSQIHTVSGYMAC
jgi:hypothetical protein